MTLSEQYVLAAHPGCVVGLNLNPLLYCQIKAVNYAPEVKINVTGVIVCI